MQFSPKNGVYMNSKDLQNAALFMDYRRVEKSLLKDCWKFLLKN